MTEYPAIRDPDRCPAHPGAILSELVEETGMTRSQVADHLGISRQQLYDVLSEKKRITPQMAVRFARFFGQGDGGLWLQMQAAHDLWWAERTVPPGEVQPFKAAS